MAESNINRSIGFIKRARSAAPANALAATQANRCVTGNDSYRPANRLPKKFPAEVDKNQTPHYETRGPSRGEPRDSAETHRTHAEFTGRMTQIGFLRTNHQRSPRKFTAGLVFAALGFFVLIVPLAGRCRAGLTFHHPACPGLRVVVGRRSENALEPTR